MCVEKYNNASLTFFVCSGHISIGLNLSDTSETRRKNSVKSLHGDREREKNFTIHIDDGEDNAEGHQDGESADDLVHRLRAAPRRFRRPRQSGRNRERAGILGILREPDFLGEFLE